MSDPSFKIDLDTDNLKGQILCSVDTDDPQKISVRSGRRYRGEDENPLLKLTDGAMTDESLNINGEFICTPDSTSYPPWKIKPNRYASVEDSSRKDLTERRRDLVLEQITAAMLAQISRHESVIEEAHREYRRSRKEAINKQIDRFEKDILKLRKEYRMLDDDDEYRECGGKLKDDEEEDDDDN